MSEQAIKQIAKNRKAWHDYTIEESFEAGIALSGTEVKSIRLGTLNLKDSYCVVKRGEILVKQMHISPYEKGNIFNRDPMRDRKLLMHKREIRKLDAAIAQQGYAIIPLSVYLKGSLVKMQIGLARGKKLHDKRDAMAARDAKREMDRAMKERMK
ncbi:MAG: SsrA-binding protein SmpB [Ruminococcaceae bacterium]|nr:SsrA-binding protein SmpB [Oscillospiraceae bacterium]